MKVLLQHVAHCRSGDKGNTSNISVTAYDPALFPLLKEQLTAERFQAFYAGVVRNIKAWEAPPNPEWDKNKVKIVAEMAKSSAVRK